jgi:chromate transporter
MTDANSHPPPVPPTEAFYVWLRVAALSFGGPASQIAVMHRILVEEKKWIGEARFLHALNYCMLLPGPEAQQLATYIGWLMHRTAGGLMAGLLFIAPGFVAIMALSVLYAGYGNLPWVAAAFFGLKAAILAVVVEAVVRIGKRALKNNVMIGLAAVAFIAIFFFAVPFPIIILAAAAFGVAAHTAYPRLIPAAATASSIDASAGVIDRAILNGHLRHITPDNARALRTAALWLTLWLTPVLACVIWLAPGHVFITLGTFFSQAAVVTFGGAYAVLAYVAQQAVEVYGWLSPREMLDGLALAETTPGPLIMVLQFVGYLAAYRADLGLSPILAGVIGSTLTVWVTFAPSFLWIFVGAPYVEALLGRRWLHAALSCITAAIVGVILNLSVWFAIHVLFAVVEDRTVGPLHLSIPDLASLDLAALLISVASMLAILRFHVGVGPTLAVAAVIGFGWKMLVG